MLPKEQTTMQYMMDILTKKRLALQKFEIIDCSMDTKYDRVLTIKRLINIAQKDEVISKYLPEEPEKYV